jgi:hypothetical protein
MALDQGWRGGAVVAEADQAAAQLVVVGDRRQLRQGLRRGLRQECPNRLLRAVNLFFVIRNTQKPGCD